MSGQSVKEFNNKWKATVFTTLRIFNGTILWILNAMLEKYLILILNQCISMNQKSIVYTFAIHGAKGYLESCNVHHSMTILDNTIN